MNVDFLNLSELSPFYKGLFKAWDLFKCKVSESAVSLHWLLEQPLVGGGRMDIQDGSTPGLTHTLCSTGVVTLRKVVDSAGPRLRDAGAAAGLLGLRSVRYMTHVLDRWSDKLCDEDFELLDMYSVGQEVPDEEDPFPEMELYPDLKDCSGILLDATCETGLDLFSMKGKTLYHCCVKVLNKHKLQNRVDSVWRKKFGESCEMKPGWRVLYKLPSKKRTGDLQWRILHGAVAMNAFISVINPTVTNECPFCGKVENVFHCFLECERNEALFSVLETLFLSFNEIWSDVVFIFGAGYRRLNAAKWQVLNFLLGEAKMSIYLTRRNKIQRGVNQELVRVFGALVRARVQIDFIYYKGMQSIDTFIQQWCYDDVICSVEGDVLRFGEVFQ